MVGNDDSLKYKVPKSNVIAIEGACARVVCDYHSARCCLYYCVSCCTKWHDHEDERNMARGSIGFKVQYKSRHREPMKESPLALFKTEDKLSLVNTPIVGEVVKNNEIEWLVGESHSFLTQGEREIVESAEFKDMMKGGQQ